MLITGGSGVLGGLLARHLAGAQAPRHLLLAPPRPGRAGRGGLAAELAGLGCQVQVAACDVRRPGRSWPGCSASLEHPLTAVVHTAGVLDDGVIGSLTPERVDRVMRPKADAALHPARADRGDGAVGVRAVLLSGGAVGSPGQGNYAAANAVLDALAQRRRARGPAAAARWPGGCGRRRPGMTARPG